VKIEWPDDRKFGEINPHYDKSKDDGLIDANVK
jgi:hypothetical protein